jgi:hypothetical protein
MSNIVELQPHIWTLTFGNAQFHDLTKNVALKELFQMLPEPGQTPLSTAYSDAYQPQSRLSKSLCTYKVLIALRNLPRLTNLRLLSSDSPHMSNHVGGWLGPHDSTLITSAWANNSSALFHTERIYDIDYDDRTLFMPVVEAIKCTQVTIRDLRIGPSDTADAQEFARTPRKVGRNSALTSLNLNLDLWSLCFCSDWANGCMLRKMLRFAPNVTLFTLSMDQTADFRMFATATSCLVETFKLRTRLNHVTIRGMWSVSDGELIDLIASHATTLTRLALKGSTLSSGSSRTIAGLAVLRDAVS